MATSRFVDELDTHDGTSLGVEISDACAAFEDYLDENGYELAVEVCPHDSEDGYFGATDASDLVLNFLGEHPEWDAHQAEINAHAFEIGEVSDIAKGDPEEEDYPDEDPDDEPGDEAP
jgi:hypothetical protein